MRHTASRRFWQCLEALPADVQGLANKTYAQLNADSSHPSLHFKKVGSGKFHSIRVGLYYRALGVPVEDGIHWFWIGTHGDYDKIIG